MGEQSRVRLAVDIGGTFTDIVLEAPSGHWTQKVLTTPSNPADGFMTGADAVLERAGIAPGQVDLIIHGTTLATNALIERKGAKTALIVTEGHRDSLEIAYENRFDQYDLYAERPTPLATRDMRWPVVERVDWRGNVLTPLDEASVEAWLPRIEAEGIESLSIGLLHAYANPAHEERVAEIIAKAYPDLPLSLSAQVCPEVREFDRQSTTVANAYVKPLMGRYLADLDTRLAERGFTCPFLMMTSGGSLVTARTAADFPIRLVESGPAGGAILAAAIAKALGEDSVLSFDMGGTTAKICLIDDGEPLLSRSFEVDRTHRFMKGSGLPVKIPVVEMVEIGAGGGSIASVDALGRIQVGPESAGADPGPACYGRGGSKPTVTDANLLLGRIDPKDFAGGSMQLDVDGAKGAMKRDLGDALSMDADGAALGLIEIVDENMASAARVHAVERGKEIADRTMIAFGGAAPLHAARVAEKLGIGKVVIPGNAGVGSAFGFLLAPVAYEVVRSRYMRLSDFDASGANDLMAEMYDEAELVVRLGAPDAELVTQRHAFMRYVGQGHEIKVSLPERAFEERDAEALHAAFEKAYSEQYGRVVPGLAVEILTWTLTLSAPSETQLAISSEAAPTAPQAVDAYGVRGLLQPGRGDKPAEASLYRRVDLSAGAGLTGPAALVEEQTTTIVPSGFSALINPMGDIVLTRDADAGAAASDLAEDIRRQVVWDRMISVVEEQAQALIRTAFSTSVREAGDLSAGIFDTDGRMLAQAVTGTPGHVNAMAASVAFFLEKYPIDTMAEGDVYLTNDPWMGTGHLFDFTVVTPAFRKGKAVALFASTVHVVDIGGRGFGPDAGQVFEEGLCIPIMKFFDKGAVSEPVMDIVRANVREPVQVVGDLYSLATCNEIGCRRLDEMMADFDLDDLTEIADHVIDTSRAAMLEAIRELPAGVYENSMTVDGYDHPLTLTAKLSTGADGLTVDFDGTSPMSAYGINVPLTYTQAYASFGVRCVVGPKVPNNAGSLGTIHVTAPEGCILNAPRPAAVNIRHVTGQMLPDVVLGCLDKAKPGCAPAEGSSSLWNPMLSGGHGIVGDADYGDATPFTAMIFHSGGTGARPGRDGLSATAFPSGVRCTPVEITETIAPVIFRRKEYRAGSGGEGKYRGGLGQAMEIEHAEGAPFAIFALFDRIQNPPRGRAGGEIGSSGQLALRSGERLRGMGKQIVPAGDALIMLTPGGGGYGPPEERDPGARATDDRFDLTLQRPAAAAE
jgi:5-oxoprolinase (ATP-hydrolysing)